MTAIKLNAGNDRNGNPRRVYVVFGSSGDVLSAIDEGYLGSEAVTILYPDLKGKPIPEFQTTPEEYRLLLKQFHP